MAAPLSGLTIANFPLDILYDAGVVYAGSTKVGATKGPPKFNPNRTITSVDFDGRYVPVKGLHRLMQGEPVLSFTLLELGGTTTGNQIDKLEPGNADATVTTVITHTMAPSGGLIASGDYIVDLRAIWERGAAGSGNYFAVLFPFALCSKYSIDGVDKNTAQIAAEFIGCIDPAGALTAAAYKLEYRTALP